MKAVFFYGLFMDPDLLLEKGLKPRDVEVVRVNDYGLRIGERATLRSSPGESAYGTLMRLDDRELADLYREPGVADYAPQALYVFDRQENAQEAVSYILPMQRVSGKNSDYARSLALVAKKVGLPDDYVDEIATWS